MSPGWTAVALRHWAHFGARYGPRWWLRHSPGPIGQLVARAAPRSRYQVRRLLEWTEGSSSPAAERQVFACYAHCLAESLAAVDPDEVRVEVEGAEQLSGAFASGRGVILTTAHSGSWEVVGAELVRASTRPLTFVMQPEPAAGARALHERLRARSGITTAYAGEPPERGLRLLEALARGEGVAFQFDRSLPRARRLEVALLGRPFAVPQGPFRVAKLSSAPILPVFNARLGFLHYRVVVYPPLRVPPVADVVALRDGAQYVADCFSDFLRQHPRQWFHFQEPLGEPAAV